MHRFHILMIGCKNTSSQFLIRVPQSLVKKFQPVLNRMQELWGKGGGELNSEECRQSFRGMSSNISGRLLNISNIIKHSGECYQTFLTSSWVGYLHAVPFLRNRMPNSLLKTPNPKFGESKG